MDDQTLDALRKALAATPANVPLQLLLVRGLLERGAREEAGAVLAQIPPSGYPTHDDRLFAGRAFLALGQAERALHVLVGDGADLDALRSRVLLTLGRAAEALHSYEAAVRANPTLEDTDLRRRIGDRLGGPAPEEAPARAVPTVEVSAPENDLARLLVPETEAVTFADVGGLEAVKDQVRRRIILPFQKPSLFQRFRRRIGGGILMYGPPGCGKTLLARATAGECGATFFNVAISDILDMYIGESESRLHAIFERARQSAPSVLFYDEIEALGGKRQFSRDSTTAKVVSQFLAEMDGFAQGNQGVLIIGATNVPWAVDPAFRRPGRFDRFLFVPPPDRETREVILQIHLANRPTEGELDIPFLAKSTSGFSGADLKYLVETAIDLAIEASIREGREVPVTAADLKAALKEVKPTTLEWLTTARNHARYGNEGGQYDDVLEFLRKHGKG